LTRLRGRSRFGAAKPGNPSSKGLFAKAMDARVKPAHDDWSVLSA
jgi:hypothetical protein